jgi:hypothetical protein
MDRFDLRRVLRRLRPVADRIAPPLVVSAPERPASQVAPIFIVGCQRSGTSLVRRIVDSHSRIACPPESKFLLPLAQVLRDDQAMRGLASMGYERDAFVASLAAYVDGLFLGYASAKGKARWADKTPNYVDCLDEIWELFAPSASFILVVRHGLDVAYSLSGARRDFPAISAHVSRAGGDRVLGAAGFWRDQNEKLETFRQAHPEACVRVRYEDLTADPESVLPSVFAFLGEPWEPGVVEHHRFDHDAGIEDPDVRRSRGIEPRVGTSAAWPDDVRERLLTEMGSVLETLGYRKDPRDSSLPGP